MAMHAQANGDVGSPGHADVLIGMEENDMRTNAYESRPKNASDGEIETTANGRNQDFIKKPEFLYHDFLLSRFF